MHTHHHIYEPRPVTFEECIRFHRHSCPGLANGFRAATAAMEALGVSRPPGRECSPHPWA
ncbi:MAG: formylmethanofuran dehydrogenase subunit E family protein [Methanoregulaceae archaeon]|nr:formylmethanofuran dehydrogenase subunit E family protein [Methanoregulaceae archaeon]